MNAPALSYEQQAGQSISAVHHALRSSRRRLVVHFLVEKILDQGIFLPSDPQMQDWLSVTAEEVARFIVSFEEDIPVKRATGDEYHSAYSSLIQSHLPRLASIRAIHYQDSRKTLRPGDNLTTLASISHSTAPLAHILFNDEADLFAGGRSDLHP